jgi:hypothetical protein
MHPTTALLYQLHREMRILRQGARRAKQFADAGRQLDARVAIAHAASAAERVADMLEAVELAEVSVGRRLWELVQADAARPRECSAPMPARVARWERSSGGMSCDMLPPGPEGL